MTIHHDKLAYGKLASLTEEFSEDRLLEMVNSLSEEEENAESEAENSEGNGEREAEISEQKERGAAKKKGETHR